jgi:hypothetical protein
MSGAAGEMVQWTISNAEPHGRIGNTVKRPDKAGARGPETLPRRLPKANAQQFNPAERFHLDMKGSNRSKQKARRMAGLSYSIKAAAISFRRSRRL